MRTLHACAVALLVALHATGRVSANCSEDEYLIADGQCQTLEPLCDMQTEYMVEAATRTSMVVCQGTQPTCAADKYVTQHSSYAVPLECADDPPTCDDGLLQTTAPSNVDMVGCTDCPPGSACMAGIATLCADGLYSEAGAEVCTVCLKCAAGKYVRDECTTTQDTNCHNCPAGYTCAGEEADPVACDYENGLFAPDRGSIACTESPECEANEFISKAATLTKPHVCTAVGSCGKYTILKEATATSDTICDTPSGPRAAGHLIEDDKPKGISNQAIAGIVIGCSLGLAAIAGVVYWCVFSKHAHNKTATDEEAATAVLRRSPPRSNAQAYTRASLHR